MIKRILPILLSLCFIPNICVFAANPNNNPNSEAPAAAAETPEEEKHSQQQGNMQIPQQNGMNRGELPPQNNDENTAELPIENSPQNSENTNAKTPDSSNDNKQNGGKAPTPNEDDARFKNQIPGGIGDGDMRFNTQNTETEPTTFLGRLIKNYPTPVTSVILLALAFVFVIFYKRKHY